MTRSASIRKLTHNYLHQLGGRTNRLTNLVSACYEIVLWVCPAGGAWVVTTMDVLEVAIPRGFRQTCWRGLRLLHPSDWEPASLPGPKEPAGAAFVDRRFQRLQLHWETLHRPPDLDRMYERRRRSDRDRPTAELKGLKNWKGMVRTEPRKIVVQAGRYFQKDACLVQATMIWPGGARDRGLERTIFGSVAMLPKGPTGVWQALGITAVVPSEFELSDVSNMVGHTRWEFRRSGRSRSGLSIERLAMPSQWLDRAIGEWLAEQIPSDMKVLREMRAHTGGHAGTDVHSRRRGIVPVMTGRGIHRLDRAWVCPTEQRVYRTAYWRRAVGEVEFPPELEVSCCRGPAPVVEPAP